jgi:hypothetical protein
MTYSEMQPVTISVQPALAPVIKANQKIDNSKQAPIKHKVIHAHAPQPLEKITEKKSKKEKERKK